MSTKTTFKRIALVTVAAMGFGLLSVAPSSAVTQTDTLAVSSAASTCVIGTACTITLTQTMLATGGDTMSVTARMTTSPTGSAALPVLTDIAAQRTGAAPGASLTTVATGVNRIQGDNLIGIMADTRNQGTYGVSTAAYTVSFTATTRGTHVITFTANNSNNTGVATNVAAVATPVTWTVTVAAGTVADTTSTSVRSKGITASGSAADQSVVVAANTGSAVAVIVTTPLTESAASTGSTTTTATITGPGHLSIAATAGTAAPNGARTVTRTGETTATMPSFIYVYGDGTTGTSTITITIGANTYTETVIFYGAAASVTSTLVTPVIHSGSGASATTGVITATVKDAAGNVVPGVTVYAVSGTTTAMASTSATTGSTGIASFSFTGLVAGTSAITVQNVATGSTATYSAAALSVRAGDNVGTSVTMTLDKKTYLQGEAAVLTVTVKDAAGNLVAPGTAAAFTSAGVVCSRACTGTLPGASHVTTGSHDGAITYAFNVPVTSGAFTLSATKGLDMLNAGSAISV